MRTARMMGIKTYAIKTAKEPSALYLRHADVICDFTENTNELPEFLDVELLVQTAKDNKVDAIHPGYGYLSENPYFAQTCEKEGIIFIGPTANAIYKMGNKTTAKQLAIKSKVPLLEGSSGCVKSVQDAVVIANKIGYPVIIKAASGGGGRGMRIVENEKEVEKMYNLASTEAEKAFNDPDVFIEKYVRNPRHIEFQILADNHGNIIHLGERECSIQRKHQKLLEESPSAVITPELRERMGEEAIKIAKTVKYNSVGTVEFLVDSDMKFYFMEMNTRIQVEHPVTEEITGIDLIEQQIKSAQGDVLTIKQEDIKLNGWAFEFRINAEDVQANFAPYLGTIQRISFPKGKNIRLETGVEEGSVITPYFDSMIAKLIVTGETREKAIANSLAALNKVRVKGLKTTIPFCKAVCENEAFKAGDLDTSFINKHMKQIYNDNAEEKQMAAFFAAMDYINEEQMDESTYVDFDKGKLLPPWLLRRRGK